MKNAFLAVKTNMSLTHLLLASMVLLPGTVKAKDNSSPLRKGPHKHESTLKDSVNEPSVAFSRLLDVLKKTGEEGKLSEHLTPNIGLSGSHFVKGRDFTTRRNDGKEYRECSIVFIEEPSDGGSISKKRPLCVYINRQVVAGKDSESYWYRINLQGALEKATVVQGKYDETGKPVQGSGVTIEKDISSPEVLNAFKAEFSYWTKDWLRQQQKAAAKTAKSAGK